MARKTEKGGKFRNVHLKVAGSGFGTDTNVVTMISKQEEIQLELLTKEMVAHKILDEILKLWH